MIWKLSIFREFYFALMNNFKKSLETILTIFLKHYFIFSIYSII
ncbi:hypothetical protein AWRIB429_0638 [Oenococcus oeni AWRIB429]|uniref:Uncharacterized protein n=1 Tax=Oenococcus oeni AWRIB429 TaxID=655225 RepID=D3L8F8_OENOE|nr:hypothetical protein AWRIB429_0638 [Oenococcus oeni AWRIB429]